MDLIRVIALTLFLFFAESASLPTNNTANDLTLTKAGSATVQWLDSSGNVHIRNFHVESRVIVMSSYDGPNPGWTRTVTNYGASGEKNDAIAAVSLRPNTDTHAIHIFFTFGAQFSMKSVVYEVRQNNWLDDNKFNKLYIHNKAPRAAISWPNEGRDPSIRLYYIEHTGSRGPPPQKHGAALYEVQYENGWSVSNKGNPVYRMEQEGDLFSNSVTAVTWSSQSGRQIRLYLYDALVMAELSWQGGTDWRQTKTWNPLLDERNFRFPLTAVTWNGPEGTQIRLYRHLARYLSRNKVHEWGFSEKTGKWTDGDLPQDIITDTDGEAQPSSVVWQNSDLSQLHIRLYQWKQTSKQKPFIAESSFDTNHDWTPNTGELTAAQSNFTAVETS